MRKPSLEDPEIIDAQVIDYDPLRDPNRSLGSRMLPCAACGTPRQVGSRFCVSCGVPFESPNELELEKTKAAQNTPKSTAPGDDRVSIETQDVRSLGESKAFRCQNCGSEVDVLVEQRSLRCPFCDSSYVVELANDQRTSQRPEFIVGFEITREKALDLFFQWIGKNSFFRPGDLGQKSATDKQQGVYIPFWHFSMTAVSAWSAQIGEYWYRTETYTVKGSDGKSRVMTRTIQETEWWPLSGIYRKFYSGYMVSASKGLLQKEALGIHPFELNAMMRYRPMYLAGWMSEEYSIGRDVALEITKQEFRNRAQNAIQSFLPGDRNSGLSVRTELEVGGSDLVLLPVHVLSYSYQNKVYRFLVNGQTGKVYGEKPWSSARIAAVVIAVALIILVLVGLVIVMNHPRLD